MPIMEVPVEPKYTGLPRRYEDTKPALDQVFTHTSILQIGENVLKKFHQNSANDKANAVDQCHSNVWKDAEEYKDKCVREALELAANEEAMHAKKLEKIHAKHVQSELARYEELMRQKCIEERYEERRDCEKRMQQMSEDLGCKHDLEQLAEVNAARIEEQSIAGSAAQEMSNRHDESLKLFGDEMQEARKMEIAALRYKLEDVRIDNEEKVREEEQEAATDRMEKTRTIHEEELNNLHVTIHQLLEKKLQLESDLSSMTKERDSCIQQYKDVRKEFTAFIESCRPDFGAGQADFLLPPK